MNALMEGKLLNGVAEENFKLLVRFRLCFGSHKASAAGNRKGSFLISLAFLVEFYDFPKAFRKLCISAVVLVKLFTKNCRCHRHSAPK